MAFYIGEKVRMKEYDARASNAFPGEAIFRGDSTCSHSRDCVALERMDGVHGGAQHEWWNFKKSDLTKLESCEKTHWFLKSPPKAYEDMYKYNIGWSTPPIWYGDWGKDMMFSYGYEDTIKPNKKKPMSMLTKFSNLFTSEPTKSFRKAGIVNSEGFLTNDGTQLFVNWLLKVNGEQFNTEVVQPLLADKKTEEAS